MAGEVGGKTAIVTGSGSGINLAFARLLLERKCNVIFADIALRPEAREVVDQYANGTPRAVFQETDVTEWQQLEKLFQTAESMFGGVDIVCPGAGIAEPPSSSFWRPPGSAESGDSRTGSHYKTLDVNLMHPIRLTQLAISHFLTAKKAGNVILISSPAGQISFLMTPLYCASKAAISSFTRCFAVLEPKHGIRINAVVPGLAKTPIWTENPAMLSMVDQEKDQWIAPEEVAEAMVALIQKPEYVGGSVLEVGLGHVRPMSMIGDPGPSGPGIMISNAVNYENAVLEMIKKPGWGQ